MSGAKQRDAPDLSVQQEKRVHEPNLTHVGYNSVPATPIMPHRPTENTP